MQRTFPVFIFLIGVCIFAGAARAIAQIDFPNLESVPQVGENLSIEIIPENPRPNSAVTITIESFFTDLNRATIIWKVNGKTEKTGVGEKKLSFATGPSGTTSTIEISIATLEGQKFSKTLSFRPAEVDLIFEPKTYTPPFYRGKALYSHRAEVVVTAIPYITDTKGNLVETKKLVYMWKYNDKLVGSASGYGKNSYTFTNASYLRAETAISVEVTPLDESTGASARINLEPRGPEAVLYEKDPLYGLRFEKALLGSFAIRGAEISLEAIPYFFSAEKRGGEGLTYGWLQNGATIAGGKSTLTLRAPQKEEKEGGRADISVLVGNTIKQIQSASANLSVNFGK